MGGCRYESAGAVMYKLRTLDVWDTLLRRKCHPECIKVSVAHHVFLRHTGRLAPQYADHWSVYRARLEVEQALAEESIRSGGDGEYSVHDVVQRWLEMIAPDHALAGSVPAIVEYEFVTEVASTTQDEDVRAVLDAYPAERTIFVSDFYWPKEMLTRLLTAKGLGAVVADGFCSCDVGLNKRTGRLFRHVLDFFRVEPEAVVHIGDNPYSDVAAAEAAGIHAVHFQPPVAHEQRLRREELFLRRELLFVEAAEQARSACDRYLGDRTDDQAAAFRAGADMAPLFAGFALFIAEQAVRDSVDKLFFLMREGEFLWRVFHAVHTDGTFRGHLLPETALLAVSRSSTFAASVRDVAAEILHEGRWPYRDHSLRALINALGIDEEDIQQALAESAIQLDDVIADFTRDSRIRLFLEHPTLRDAAARNACETRELLTAYLHAQGFFVGGRHAVVDVGWRGTIQSNLAYLGLSQQLHGYYVARQNPLTPVPTGCEMTAYLIDEASSTMNVDLLETYGVMEMLCTADTGSTTGYRRKGGEVVPVHTASNCECPVYEGVVRHFQDGVLFGCQAWSPLIARYGCCASDVAPSALAAWRNLAGSPAQVIVEAFGETMLDDPNAQKRFLKPKDVPGIATIAAAFWNRRARNDLRDYLRRIRWRQAIQQPASQRTIGNRIVGTLLAVGSCYRRLKSRLRSGSLRLASSNPRIGSKSRGKLHGGRHK